MNNAILKTHNLHKRYMNGEEELHVLKDVNIEVEKGTILSVLGPSGAGKSTLLHLLGGLDYPTQGEVVFKDKNLYTLGENERAKMRNEGIGFVFQFYHLLPEFNALENVVMPGLIAKGETKRLELRARSLLEEMALGKRMTHRPAELSGGEQQRVAIARALINNPDIVLCDEPTGNLDSKSSERVFNLIRKLNKDRSQTFVIVTHEERIADLAHRVVRIYDGVLIEEKK